MATQISPLFDFASHEAERLLQQNGTWVESLKEDILDLQHIPKKWERHSGKMPDGMGIQDPVDWRKVKKLKSHTGGH